MAPPRLHLHEILTLVAQPRALSSLEMAPEMVYFLWHPRRRRRLLYKLRTVVQTTVIRIPKECRMKSGCVLSLFGCVKHDVCRYVVVLCGVLPTDMVVVGQKLCRQARCSLVAVMEVERRGRQQRPWHEGRNEKRVA